MRDEDRGNALVLEDAVNLLPKLNPELVIEVAERLVHEDQLGPGGE